MLRLDTELSSHNSYCDYGWQPKLKIGASACLPIMGSGLSIPKDSPLACVLKNLKPLLLKVSCLKRLCIQIWPQYQLDNQNHWPEFGTFDFYILQNLTNFLKWNGKWSEIPYAQAFWALWSRPSLCKACSTYEVLLYTLPPKQKGSSSSTNSQPWPSAPPEFNHVDEPLPTSHTIKPPLSPHRTHILTLKCLLSLPGCIPDAPGETGIHLEWKQRSPLCSRVAMGISWSFTRLLYSLTLFSWGQFLEKDSAIFLVANIPQGGMSECFSPKGGIWLITFTAGARNIQISLWTYISIYFAYTSRRGISGRCVFNFMAVPNSFPQWLLYLKFSAICWSSSCFTSLTAFDLVCFVILAVLVKCEMIFHCGFNLDFSDD